MKMNQANIEKLVSKLRYNVKSRRQFRNPEGPLGRLRKFQKTLTALIKYERLELNYSRADETRGYVDQARALLFALYYSGSIYNAYYDVENIFSVYSDVNNDCCLNFILYIIFLITLSRLRVICLLLLILFFSLKLISLYCYLINILMDCRELHDIIFAANLIVYIWY